MYGFPNWLMWSASLAGESLVLAVYVAGIVVLFRRWHLGTAARLGAIGFAILLAESLTSQAFTFGAASAVSAGGLSAEQYSTLAVVSWTGFRMMTVAGHLLLLFALRIALADSERARSAASVVRDDRWPPGAAS